MHDDICTECERFLIERSRKGVIKSNAHIAFLCLADDHIDLQLWREDEALVIEMRDRGLAFDPSRSCAADTGSDLDNRPIGGLGVHLVQTLSDDIRYRRLHNENQTVVRLRVARP